MKLAEPDPRRPSANSDFSASLIWRWIFERIAFFYTLVDTQVSSKTLLLVVSIYVDTSCRTISRQLASERSPSVGSDPLNFEENIELCLQAPSETEEERSVKWSIIVNGSVHHDRECRLNVASRDIEWLVRFGERPLERLDDFLGV